ncbi:MAG: hypothetical protein ACPGVH_02125 [Chitinophagales bacterium]
MNKIYLSILLFLSFLSVFAGGENTVVGAGAAAMGGTYSTSQNVFSAHNNPAGLGFVDRIGFGLYADRPFLVKEINNFNLSVALPFQKIGTFGVDVNFLGYSAYNEMRAGFAYGRSFGEKVSLGVKFDYLRLAIRNNGAKNTFAFGVGLQYQPFKVLRIGVNVYNPVPLNLDAQYKEKLATNFNLGLSYIPSEKFMITVEGEKELNEKIRFKAGLEYRPLKPLFLRVGGATNPTLISFGLGTEFKNFKLDASATYHLQLGFTPQISLVYNIQKKKKSE